MTGLPSALPPGVGLPFPGTGAVRVHPTPDQLPPNREIGTKPTHRYDDPTEVQTYRVRYLASTVRGCLLEVLAQFRPDRASAQQALDEVEGVDDEPGGRPDAWQTSRRGLAPFLAKARVGRGQLLIPGQRMVSVNHPNVMSWLDVQPEVRDVLGCWPVELGGGRSCHVTEGMVRADAPLGYRLCQVASHLLHQHADLVPGLHYRSRHADGEDCWAVYERTRITFTDVAALSPDVPEHLEAVRSVADTWGLALPEPWLPPQRQPDAPPRMVDVADAPVCLPAANPAGRVRSS